MSTLTKLALGVMGQLRSRPAKGNARPISVRRRLYA